MTINAMTYLPPALRSQVASGTCLQEVTVWLQQAVDAAIAAGTDLHIPAGVWPIHAYLGPTDPDPIWTIRVPDGRRLRIFGDGKRTVLRRHAIPSSVPIELPNTSVMVAMQANQNIAIEWHAIQFDGHERAFGNGLVHEFIADGVETRFEYPATDARLGVTLRTGAIERIQTRGSVQRSAVDPMNQAIDFLHPPPINSRVRLCRLWEQEHCANLAFVIGSGTPALLELKEVTMTGCIGDGLWVNVPVSSVHIFKFRSFGRTRRVRADLQFSAIPLDLRIEDFVGDAMEAEIKSGGWVPADHHISIRNATVRGAFDFGSEGAPLNIEGHKIRQAARFGVADPAANFVGLNGRFSACNFAAIYLIRGCNLVFDGGIISLIGYPDQLSTARPVSVSPVSEVRFDGVLFKVVPGFPGAPAIVNGHYMERDKATPDISRVTHVRNCSVASALDHFAVAERCGTFILEGGKLDGREAVVHIGNGGGGGEQAYVTNVCLRDPEHWRGSASHIDAAFGGPSKISMSGQFDATNLLPVSATSGTGQSAQLTWEGRFDVQAPTDPNGWLPGLPGMRVHVLSPTSDWKYVSTAAFGETSYAP